MNRGSEGVIGGRGTSVGDPASLSISTTGFEYECVLVPMNPVVVLALNTPELAFFFNTDTGLEAGDPFIPCPYPFPFPFPEVNVDVDDNNGDVVEVETVGEAKDENAEVAKDAERGVDTNPDADGGPDEDDDRPKPEPEPPEPLEVKLKLE